MHKAVYIVLGSNYDVNQEHRIKFIQEIMDQGYQVNVYSIDMNIPSSMRVEVNDKLSITRINMKLNDKNIDQLVKKIFLQEKQIDLLIVMDGIDFKGIVFGDDVKQKMQLLYPELSDFPVIHFISPKYQEPVFNGISIADLDFTDFHLTAEPMMTRLLPFVKDITKLKKIDDQISKQSNKYSQLLIFMQSTGFNNLFSNPDEAKKIINEELTKHVCDQIDLNKISIKRKHRLS